MKDILICELSSSKKREYECVVYLFLFFSILCIKYGNRYVIDKFDSRFIISV